MSPSASRHDDIPTRSANGMTTTACTPDRESSRKVTMRAFVSRARVAPFGSGEFPNGWPKRGSAIMVAPIAGEAITSWRSFRVGRNSSPTPGPERNRFGGWRRSSEPSSDDKNLRYTLQTDSGMAPCVDDGLLTLATCKPKIRARAMPGDWVLGFYPRPFDRGLLAWAGRVARKARVGDYEREFRGRSDAVYCLKPDGSFRRLRRDYHSTADHIRKDLSAAVLIFDEQATWYFGDEPRLLPDHLLHLAAGGQGHRVSGVRDGDAALLLKWLASCHAPGIIGKPRQPMPTPIRPRRC